jgi:mannose-6-phosphate isomerase-like protein (cupin superfamily)
MDSPVPVNLAEKLKKISEHWHPYIIGQVNDNHVKLAKLKGEFVWHQHDHEDELFMVLSGTLFIEFRDKTREIKAGEIIVVPKGVAHRPHTNPGEEVCILLVEPAQIKHTGDVVVPQTVHHLDWI